MKQAPAANSNRFDALVKYRWTINSIRGMFSVPCPIAEHIQETAWKSEADAWAIANAAKSLLNGQVGF